MKRPQEKTPQEVDYFTAEVLMNDFIDNEMPHLKPAEIKLALVIWRKTIGWGKRSEEIGRLEFCTRAKLDKDTIKDVIRPLCDKLGIRYEQTRAYGVLSRRRFTWPINERVAASLASARKHWEAGGKLPLTRGRQITPDGGGPYPPTQYDPCQSDPRMKADSSPSINFGDRKFYSKCGQPE